MCSFEGSVVQGRQAFSTYLSPSVVLVWLQFQKYLLHFIIFLMKWLWNSLFKSLCGMILKQKSCWWGHHKSTIDLAVCDILPYWSLVYFEITQVFSSYFVLNKGRRRRMFASILWNAHKLKLVVEREKVPSLFITTRHIYHICKFLQSNSSVFCVIISGLTDTD